MEGSRYTIGWSTEEEWHPAPASDTTTTTASTSPKFSLWPPKRPIYRLKIESPPRKKSEDEFQGQTTQEPDPSKFHEPQSTRTSAVRDVPFQSQPISHPEELLEPLIPLAQLQSSTSDQYAPAAISPSTSTSSLGSLASSNSASVPPRSFSFDSSDQGPAPLRPLPKRRGLRVVDLDA